MSYEVKSLNEECGIFGVWGHPDAARVTYFGLHSLQHRGQEGAGIVVNQEGILDGYRGLGLLSEVFKDERQLNNLKGTAAIGHVRYATAGNGSVDNIQPFLFKFYDTSIGLAHNGNLTNARTLRRELETDGAIFHSNSDTEILMHLIRRSKETTFIGQLKEALNKVKGGFAYLLMTENAMIAALDPNGFRPLSIGQMKNGSYVVASETCALEVIGAAFIRDVQPGELVIINEQGVTIDTYTTDTQPAICAMEYIYFARPDSNIAGVNVHTARKNMGRRLAQEASVAADMVVGVPNSSLSAASGYAEASGIPYEMGLVKNQYIARTFIQPTQELREQGVRMKLSAVRGVVEGKKVIMVDDSIVRGTTSRRIVQLLKEAGAKEVHVRIAAPPLKYPCFYGIDIQTRKELIAANHSIEEICEEIGADSLSFLSEDGLIDAIGLTFDAPYSGLCMAYFNGDYPTPLYDYEEKYQASLKEKTSFF
ncbi:amidophosphoribosyltransferase [Enterococcus phoeniculicola]|jgi:amidophosphoribosyltransferase|uniref:Amidophosphoribosyltransferase n=1 Tax=Enterococcus phoeniculicola ATCC BAA-412 TaxID=1158610 RepID=R3TQS8_9ENTE|nr:amidophosphoribosyltransferase [Enterococcus phoeniculicola]EOL43884.1 amidophosphoribosyltransferase [Enterococcus phoeniculicola ATCC BAA-412]EOT76752.1 amidophosphoribosyltransferase [Enterococcus phoeniculicola ATCC BAA-412]